MTAEANARDEGREFDRDDFYAAWDEAVQRGSTGNFKYSSNWRDGASRSARNFGGPVMADSEQKIAYLTATLEQLAAGLAATQQGARNHTLNVSTLRAKRIALACGVDPDEVDEAMRDAARTAGLDDREIEGTLRSADNAARREGPARIDWAATIPTAYELGAASEEPSRFITGGKFIRDSRRGIPIIWGEGTEVLWAEGESLMIAGPMGLGKTTLGGQLMRAQMGLGDGTLLGWPVKPADGPILYLAMDRPAQAARALARQYSDEELDVLDRKLIVWQGPPPADVARNPSTLLELARSAGAAVVYLDSVKDAAIGLSEDEVGAGYNRARQLLLANSIQLVELHHTTKRGANGGAPKEVADIYGSTWITNGTGSIFLLSGEPGDPIVGMRHARQPMAEVGPLQLHHDQEAGTITLHLEGGIIDLVHLADAAGAEGLTAKAAAAALYAEQEKPTSPANVEKARRKLDKLTGTGKPLVKVDGKEGGSQAGQAGSRPALWFINNSTVLEPQ